jgi:hypothetical protein
LAALSESVERKAIAETSIATLRPLRNTARVPRDTIGEQAYDADDGYGPSYRPLAARRNGA